MSTMTTTISEAHTAFTQAAEAVVAVTDRLLSADIAPQDMILSVSLTASSPDILKDGIILSAIMGVYRVAAERGLPVEDPAITVSTIEGLLRVTITAHAKDETDLSERFICPSNRQWHAGVIPPHKESPGFLFPVIRRSYEGCLKALSAALNRDVPARCIIHPIIMDEQEIEIPTESDTPRKEIRYSLSPTSVQELCDHMHNWFTPIFCMSEEDTRSLLAIPPVLDSLNRLIDMGYPILVLGESCKPFAERGFLPATLTTIKALPTSGTTATVTYAFPVDAATRLLRTDLLASVGGSQADDRHLLTLRLPDGTAIPDGFVGQNGKVLGLLNGVDTTVLPCLRETVFHI